MRQRILRLLYAFSTLPLLTLAARSDEVPHLHVDQLCRGVARHSSDPIGGHHLPKSFEQCVQAEGTYRKELKREWAKFTSGDKKRCTVAAAKGGSSSYAELLTCLEMAHEVKNLRRSSQNRGVQNGPSK
jgi:hypothetical protein